MASSSVRRRWNWIRLHGLDSWERSGRIWNHQWYVLGHFVRIPKPALGIIFTGFPKPQNPRKVLHKKSITAGKVPRIWDKTGLLKGIEQKCWCFSMWDLLLRNMFHFINTIGDSFRWKASVNGMLALILEVPPAQHFRHSRHINSIPSLHGFHCDPNPKKWKLQKKHWSLFFVQRPMANDHRYWGQVLPKQWKN